MVSEKFHDDLHLDSNVELREEEGNRAWFGRNVLQGLITGLMTSFTSASRAGSDVRTG